MQSSGRQEEPIYGKGIGTRRYVEGMRRWLKPKKIQHGKRCRNPSRVGKIFSYLSEGFRKGKTNEWIEED
jgi:hypothetical protein